MPPPTPRARRSVRKKWRATAATAEPQQQQPQPMEEVSAATDPEAVEYRTMQRSPGLVHADALEDAQTQLAPTAIGVPAATSPPSVGVPAVIAPTAEMFPALSPQKMKPSIGVPVAEAQLPQVVPLLQMAAQLLA